MTWVRQLCQEVQNSTVTLFPLDVNFAGLQFLISCGAVAFGALAGTGADLELQHIITKNSFPTSTDGNICPHHDCID